MARRLPPCHCPEWLATVEDIGQIYGWWLGEVELTFDPLSTLPLSVYPWREDSRHAIAQSAWRLPLPRVAGETVDLGEVFSKAPEQAKFISRDEDRDIVQPLSTLSPSHAQSEEANSLARRLPSRMRSVETSKLRVNCSIYRGGY